MDTATRYFRETAATDLADTSDGSSGGVHIAALGGLWQAAVFGFAGLSLRADALYLAPNLPPGWNSLAFQAHWRGRQVKLEIDRFADRITATLVAGTAMTIAVHGQRHTLRPDAALECGYRPAAAPVQK